MNISYEGIGCLAVTFPNKDARIGEVCVMGTDGLVRATVAGEEIWGLVEAVHGGCVGVRIHGFTTVPYTGTAPQPGMVCLKTDGKGGVSTADSGKTYRVAAVDKNAKTVTFEL